MIPTFRKFSGESEKLWEVEDVKALWQRRENRILDGPPLLSKSTRARRPEAGLGTSAGEGETVPTNTAVPRPPAKVRYA